MTDDILARLAAPFSPEIVSWRVGAMTKDSPPRGMALAYVDARDVQDRLDEVCGIYWQSRYPWASETLITCEIGIKVDDEWLWRGDGAGEIEVDGAIRAERKEQQQDMARKAAFSDSFKRAAVRWGIGRYLYDLPSPWVELEARGDSWIIPDRELARLRGMRAKPSAAPASAHVPARPAKEVSAPPHAPAIVEDANAREEATGHYRRIRHSLLEVVKTPTQIDGLIKLEGGSYDLEQQPRGNLGVIHSVSPEAYRQIIAEANARKMEMRGGTP